MRFLPGEAIRAPRLSEFKKHLDDALRHTDRFSAGLMLPGISVHSGVRKRAGQVKIQLILEV